MRVGTPTETTVARLSRDFYSSLGARFRLASIEYMKQLSNTPLVTPINIHRNIFL